MDPTAPNPRPQISVPRTNRRRRFRHKLHSPIFASFKSPERGVIVDLSELLDLTEDGFAVHTPEPLAANQPLALTLDLPETRTYIHDQGLVIWSDPSGRAGVRFSHLSDANRRLLQQGLFANLLVAAAHYAARTEQLARRLQRVEAGALEPPADSAVPAKPPDPALTAATLRADLGQSRPTPPPQKAAADKAPPAAAQKDPQSDAVLDTMLAAVDAVRQKVKAYSQDPDGALHLITACALGLTNADGAALALFDRDSMICRARSGDNAPPLGARVDVQRGLSGECVRRGQIIRCDDTANDTRVDRESCRSLHIGSILAVPIRGDSRVVGLLEVFSPSPHAFTRTHETVLQQLAEIVPTTMPKVPVGREDRVAQPSPRAAKPAVERPMDAVRDALWDQESEQTARRSASLVRNLYFGLLALVVAGAALGAGYLLAPAIQRQWFRSSSPSNASTVAAATPQSKTGHISTVPSAEDLRSLAQAGDADAQYFLAVRYHTGTNVVQDDSEAVKWFERAANQGHVLAQASLPSYYWSGTGVPKDLTRAYFWAALAWAQGDENSKTTLEGLSTQMTRAQVEAARQQADAWLRQHNQNAKRGARR